MNRSSLQHVMFAALVAAVTPYAAFRVLSRQTPRVDLATHVAPFAIEQADIYDDLIDGEVAAG